jgi:uridine kinase
MVFIIGVAGGTASGKTSVCDAIVKQLSDHRIAMVCLDSFYRSLTDEELEYVSSYNFDHPGE